MPEGQAIPPNVIPHDQGWSPGWIATALAAYIAAAALTLLLTHLDVIPLAPHPTLRAHVMSAAFGMLGASIRLLRKHYRSFITNATSARLSYGWMVYYISRPPIGAVIAAMLYLLTFVGVRIMTTGSDLDLSQEGRLILCGAAFLAGYGASDALNRIEAASGQLFSSQNDVSPQE